MLLAAKNLVYLQAMLLIGWSIFYYSLQSSKRSVVGHFPVLVLSAMSAVLLLSPVYSITSAVFFLFPIVACRTRKQLLIVMTIGMLATPALQTQVQAGGLWLFTWSLQSTFGLGGLIALFTTRKDPVTGRSGMNLALLLFLTLVIAIATRETAVSNWTRQTVMLVCTYGVPAFVIANCLRSEVGRQTLLVTLAGLGCMLAVELVYEARAHWPLYAGLADRYGLVRGGVFIVKFRGGAMRAYGPMDEATNAGFTLVILFAAALACNTLFKKGGFRYLIPAIILLGVAAPQSRGALIGAGVVILAQAFYRYGAAGLGKAVAILAPIAAVYYARRSATGPLTDAESTSDYRSQLFTRGMQEFWHHPIAGETMARVYAQMDDLRQGEGIVDFVNTYLYFALATGIIGFIAFCFVLLLPIGQLLTKRRNLLADPATGAFAGFAFATFVAGSVMLIFTSIQQHPMILMLALAGAVSAIQRPRSVSLGRQATRAPAIQAWPVL
ncbi:O-antigen ligase family protein [Sphingomonas sp. PAMC 26621]|uniref:O-antigen ligase family protein n=1 Tax=Sphingomonas sp. PAMC 26621 TaxID=1112213 RepID=UPI0002D2D813|nr:O-antigen ligase family protein [Sphingomonas sp. PAMC 26621]